MSLDPTTTTRLLALPSLREQAEKDAREALTICDWYGDGDPNETLWRAVQSHEKVLAHFAALLADLTRWQSQAWALREIGRLAGFKTISGSVPTIRGIPDEKRAILVVECGAEAMCFNLPEITTRPAAIAAILLHLSESR